MNWVVNLFFDRGIEKPNGIRLTVKLKNEDEFWENETEDFHYLIELVVEGENQESQKYWFGNDSDLSGTGFEDNYPISYNISLPPFKVVRVKVNFLFGITDDEGAVQENFMQTVTPFNKELNSAQTVDLIQKGNIDSELFSTTIKQAEPYPSVNGPDLSSFSVKETDWVVPNAGLFVQDKALNSKLVHCIFPKEEEFELTIQNWKKYDEFYSVCYGTNGLLAIFSEDQSNPAQPYSLVVCNMLDKSLVFKKHYERPNPYFQYSAFDPSGHHLVIFYHDFAEIIYVSSGEVKYRHEWGKLRMPDFISLNFVDSKIYFIDKYGVASLDTQSWNLDHVFDVDFVHNDVCCGFDPKTGIYAWCEDLNEKRIIVTQLVWYDVNAGILDRMTIPDSGKLRVMVLPTKKVLIYNLSVSLVDLNTKRIYELSGMTINGRHPIPVLEKKGDKFKLWRTEISKYSCPWYVEF